MNLALKEVTKKCRLARKGDPKAKKDTYKSGLLMLGLTVPCLRSIFKEGFSFKTQPLSKQLGLWMDIWNNSPHHEIKTLALFFFSSLDDDFLLKNWNKIKTIPLEIENWAHADSYCSIVARLFELVSAKFSTIFLVFPKGE